MYAVSDAFLMAIKQNTRRYYWTGKITTTGGAVYEFTQGDIVKGSGYISRQCCGSTEIELGTVYAAEMGISLFSDIDRYTLEDALVELSYHLLLADGTYVEVPMGIFEISEANRTAHCLELKAYDYMLRFEKSFNGFETIGTAYGLAKYAFEYCKKLESANLNLGNTTIGTFAFRDCISLENVTLPESMKILGVDVFYGCCSLQVSGKCGRNFHAVSGARFH